ncbi:Abi family protein [Peptococcus simiae]|uniref:Abi family protein n=1 Tax=Peptococcus simiae TaxID=1643805 RepID=UPI0039818F02
MQLKPPLTYDEQIEKLKNDHNLTISDECFAKEVLMKVSYYRLSGYGIGLKKPNNREHYKDSITIEQLFSLYCFDSQFKNNLIRTIEQIEIELRAKITHHLSIKYGSTALMEKNNFIYKKNKKGKPIYTLIRNNLDKEIERQKNKPFVKHHLKKYDGNFPIWAAIELMSFGTLSSLFSILKFEDQKEISNQFNTSPKYLKNWILCLVEVRNICAHYTRLYNMPLKENPRLYTENEKYKKKQNKIFPILLIIKRMLNSNEQWTSLLRDLKKSFNKYQGAFNFSFMGFPENWEEVL